MAEQPQAPNATGRRILRGTNLAIYTVIAVAIIVLINWFSSQHVQRWDLTKNQKYSLSAQSLKLVKGLKDDVTIYVFDRDQSFRAEGDLLNLYPAASHRVAVRYVDPNRDPALAKNFGVTNYGTVVVAAGNRHFNAQSSTEEGVTNALIRVLKSQSTVYFIQGHGERSPESAEGDGLSEFSKALSNENDSVKSVALMEQKIEIPSDATLVVIAGPQHDYLQPEVDALQKYLAGGGRLLMMLDPGVDLPLLAKLAADYNFTPQNDLVIDQNPIAQVFGARPEMPLILKYGASPITQPLERTATLFPLTRSFEVNKAYKNGLTVDDLCDTTADSYGVPNWTPAMREIRPQPKTDLKGPLTVAVAADLSTGGEGKPNARLVALGTSRLPANSFISFQGNRDLIMNAVDWLTANESMISVRPKAPDAQHLNLTAQQMSTILFRLIAVPVVIIAAGIIVWWGRR
ncbi:MAG TPA: Gldg family protein [Terriglobia bacterium]|nr:Gldg family protein [Terriglobia bacterium]